MAVAVFHVVNFKDLEYTIIRRGAAYESLY
jgi:hypothetical protein